MKASAMLWTLSVVLAVVFGVWQRVSGPTYPLYGHAVLNGAAFKYTLERTHAGAGDHAVVLHTGAASVNGALRWREHADGAPWRVTPMTLDGKGGASGPLPHHGPGQKVDYAVVLVSGSESITLPASGFATLRFRNDVPWWILIPHIIVMMAALMLSTRAALEALANGPQLKEFALRTVSALFVGGFLLGCAVSAYAFGQPWGGFPIDGDATDNKTLVAFLAWAVAAVFVVRAKADRPPRAIVFAAAVVMTVVYLIPHSFVLHR